MHLSWYQLHRYRHARLTPTELLTLDDHLLHCEFCRQQLRGPLPPPTALTALQTPWQEAADDTHALPAQLLAYLHHTTTAVERELIASHLEACSACTAQLWSLRCAAATPPLTWRVRLAEWRVWVLTLWPMPVSALLVLALVALADHFSPRPQPRVASAPIAVLQLTHPIATSIATPQPTFRWQALPGAAQYVVKVFSTNHVLLAESPTLSTTTWTLPVALARGQTYRWQVFAFSSTAPSFRTAPVAEATFTVLGEDSAAKP